MSTLLIRVENNGTAIQVGSSDFLPANRTGYYGVASGSSYETDSTGAIVAVTLAGISDHTNSLEGAVRVGVGSVNSIKVGVLGTGGKFSTYLSS